jgi:hypothetical protein
MKQLNDYKIEIFYYPFILKVAVLESDEEANSYFYCFTNRFIENFLDQKTKRRF